MFGLGLLPTLAALGVSASVVTGLVGYFKGRMDCAAIHETAALKQRIAFLERDIQAAEAAAEFARKKLDEAAKIEADNDAATVTGNRIIDNAPIIANCVPSDFTSWLRKLR